MAGHDQVLALFDLLVDDALEQIRIDRIKAGERFIENQQLRITQQREHELDLLLVALGKLIGLFRLRGTLALLRRIEIFRRFKPLRPIVDALLRLRTRNTAQRSKIEQLIHQRILRIEAALLREIADIAGLQRQRAAVPFNRAAVLREHIQNHTDRRCFAGAVRAEQRIDTRLLHLKAEMIDDNLFPVLFI